MVPSNRIFFIFIIMLIPLGSSTQDLTGFKKLKPIDWSASVNAGTTSVINNAKNSLYSPFAYSVGVNASLSIYGFNLPFSFTYRDRQASYGASFSRFSLTPTYKWAKLYIGHSQVEYNRYLLSGIQIFGLGVDLNPGLFRLAVITGMVYNPKVVFDSLTYHSGVLNPYNRKVTAVKIGIGKNRNYFDISLLVGNDSGNPTIESDSTFFPLHSNTCLGMSSSVDLIGKTLNLSINTAASAYTHNINSAELEEGDLSQNGLLSSVNKLIDPNKSTSLSFAGDAVLGYSYRNFSLKARYQRIDPFYKSFGVNFLRGDRENISLQSSISLFNGILAISGSYGIDRNNLVKLRTSTVKQKIYDVNVQITPIHWFGVEAQISNYNFDQQPSFQNVMDTIRFIQVNSTNSISPYLRFYNKLWQHSLNLNVTKQSLNDLTANDFAMLNSSNVSYSVGYQIRNKPNKWNAGINVFRFEYKTEIFGNSRSGITLNLAKTFMKDKLNIRIRSSISNNWQNKKNAGLQLNIGPTITIKLGKGTLMLQHNYISRQTVDLSTQFNESRFYTNYSMPIK
ncbi:MAG TPA: hypothetical protein PKA12_04160 [Saprospiraceae bacterium]|nr:hypothetical protein [Saprospiraceae bacterium]